MAIHAEVQSVVAGRRAARLVKPGAVMVNGPLWMHRFR